MKNKLWLFAVIIFPAIFCMTTCGEGNTFNNHNVVTATDGSLTILNIPAQHNGKNIYAIANVNDGGRIIRLRAVANISANNLIFGKVSSSGTVTLRIWTETSTNYGFLFENFDGDYRDVIFSVVIFENIDGLTERITGRTNSVHFSRGTGSGNFIMDIN